MSREKTAKIMIEYLEERVNCENVISMIEGNKDSSDTNHLVINRIPNAIHIIKHNDNKAFVNKEKKEILDENQLKKTFEIFDFMTEANYTGFEYFPYLYGVLNCHDGENSKAYVFYEYFENSLDNLINNIEHASEWYDIVFQMILINYYVSTVNGYSYDVNLSKHFYRKLIKPYYKEYIMNDIMFNVNHKYIIVLWDIDMEKEDEKKNADLTSNIDILIDYIKNNRSQMKTPPTNRIMEILYDVKENPQDSINVLIRYYGSDSTAKTK